MEISEPLLASIIIPTILVVLRSLLGDEIRYWGILIHSYFNRPFDVDHNPKTHDWAMIYNPGNGEWECCSLTFNFGIRKSRNGVFVHRYDKHWRVYSVERVDFHDWRVTRKAVLNKENLPSGLSIEKGYGSIPK